MKMKRLFQVFMFVLIGGALFACGPKEEPINPDPEPTPVEHTHEFGEVSYVWAADNLHVTATRTCACGEKQEEVVAATSVEKTPASCTSNLVLTYTSAAFENAAFAVQTKDVEMPNTKLEHAFGEVTYEWAENNETVKAIRVCANCTEKEEETVAATSVEKVPAACTTNQVLTYTSAAFENAAFAVQTKDVEVADSKLYHNLVEVPAVAASCTVDGVKAYYICDRVGCEAKFEDAEGLVAIADLDAWKLDTGKVLAHHTPKGEITATKQRDGIWYDQDTCSVCSEPCLIEKEVHNMRDCYSATKGDELTDVALTVIGFCGANGFAAGSVLHMVAFDGYRAMTLRAQKFFTYSGYSVSYEGREIQLGDTLLISTIVRETAKYIYVKEGSTVLFGDRVDVTKMDMSNAISMKDKSTTDNLYSYDIGGFYKFTATEEHPLYINGRSSSSNNVTYDYLTMFADGNGLLNEETLAGNDKLNMRYLKGENGRTLGSVLQNWRKNLGDQWLVDNFGDTFKIGDGGELEGALLCTEQALGTYAFKGTFYLYTVYAPDTAGTDKYLTAYILPAGMNLTRITPPVE